MSTDNDNNNSNNNEESITYSEHPPPQLERDGLSPYVEDQVGDFTEPRPGAVPLFYFQNK